MKRNIHSSFGWKRYSPSWAAGIEEFFSQMHYVYLNPILIYLCFLLSVSWHEAAHAWAAMKLGDDTAAKGGQVSLNPWRHIREQPWGMLIVPFLMFGFNRTILGWGSTPHSHEWARLHPKRFAIMALAGPLANLGIALLAGLVLRLCAEAHIAATQNAFVEIGIRLMSITFIMNSILFVLNLLPIPPLDGTKVVLLLLSSKAAEKYGVMLMEPFIALAGFALAFFVMSYAGPFLMRSSLHLLYLNLHR